VNPSPRSTSSKHPKSKCESSSESSDEQSDSSDDELNETLILSSCDHEFDDDEESDDEDEIEELISLPQPDVDPSSLEYSSASNTPDVDMECAAKTVEGHGSTAEMFERDGTPLPVEGELELEPDVDNRIFFKISRVHLTVADGVRLCEREGVISSSVEPGTKSMRLSGRGGKS
jgi:hypothetical protein